MVKKLLFLILVFALMVCAVSASDLKVDLKSGLTDTVKTSVKFVDNKMTFTDKLSKINVTTGVKIDGVDIKPVDIKTNEKGEYTFKSDKDGTAQFNYSYFSNGTVKETIVLQKDMDLSFPIEIPDGYKMINLGPDWRVVSATSGDTMTGLTAVQPFGVDADGYHISMYYTWDGSNLNLNYNRIISKYNITSNLSEISGISYPLLVDPTWYSTSGYWTAFDGAYTIIMWNTTGNTTWNVPNGVTSIWYLIVAGGGGGTYGGGGAGGLLNNTIIISSTYYNISVGQGGLASYSETGNGTNSSFFNATLFISSKGGGVGGPSGCQDVTGPPGMRGGSGGGGGADYYDCMFTKDGIGGNNVTGQGFGGGRGSWSPSKYQYSGGGGGGASKNGSNAIDYYGGMGGNGTQINITGILTYYAGGGGGSVAEFHTIASGGLGGGGNGGNADTPISDPATAGTNGLGGGGGGASYSPANGGSGIVIIRYLTPLLAPNFTGNDTTIYKNQNVSFTDTTIGNPSTWNWTFGDSGTSTLQNPTHQYTSTGSYNVALTVTNLAGLNTTTKTNFVTVSSPVLYAEFTGNITSGVSPLSVQFNDQTNTTFGAPTAWCWTFGGANFSALQNPIYTFTGAGHYNVSLNVSGPGGYNKTTKVNYINVSAALTNPLSYINITPYMNQIVISQTGSMQVNIKNITASAVYANISFNKSAVTVINVANNYSVIPGLTISSTVSNTTGFVYLNISNSTGGPIIVGNSLTPLADITFKTLSYQNGTAPLNFNGASELLTFGDIEDTVDKIPGKINTTNGFFNFQVNLYNVATNSLITTLATINTSGSNISPTFQQTDSGSAMYASNFGNVSFDVQAQGFYELNQTVLIYDDSDVNLRLTPLTGPQQNTWYSPHQVRITCIDSVYGTKLVGYTVNITPLTDTFPSGSTDWLVNIYGVNAGAANDMLNGTLIMNGITGSDGSATFTMLSSIGYNINIVNNTLSINSNAKLYPIENDYNIRVVTSTDEETSEQELNGTQLTYEAPNATFGTFGLSFIDLSGETDSVNFSVFNVDNNTLMYAIDIASPGTSVVYANYTIPAVSGEQYIWEYNASRSADTPPYASSAMGATMKNYTRVSLGIENLPGMTLPKATTYYNWISMGFLFLIGAMSSKRMTRFFALLIPIMAALFVFFGWLQAPNAIQTWGTIVMCGLMGTVTYMKGSLRENFGGGGPGSLIINIVFYLIILQTCVGIVTTTGVWTNPTTNHSISMPNSQPTAYQMNAPNADLTNEIPKISNSGGLLQDVMGTAGILTQLAISCVMMLVKIVVTIAAFSLVLAQMFPFLTTSAAGMFLLAGIQIGIWFAYVLFFVNVMAKPFPDSTAF